MAINTTAKTNGTVNATVPPAFDMQAFIADTIAKATAGLSAEVAKLKAENAKLATAPKPEVPLTCRVSLKGAVSVYGLGRFPVTLYKSQWLRLFAFMDKVKAFIIANDATLKSKE